MNVYNVTNCKWKEYIVSNALKKDWIFSVLQLNMLRLSFIIGLCQARE